MWERDEYFISDGLAINTVYGVSAIGTQMCLYSLSQETGDIEPATISNQQYRNIDTVPEKWWSLDVLSLEGEQRMMGAELEEAEMYAFSFVGFVH